VILLFTKRDAVCIIFVAIHFSSAWSLLHCVDERDVTVDKTNKIYKSRPIVSYLIEKFQYYYVPECELSLDEGMIPTKNCLSIMQYIKNKTTKWGTKTFILCEARQDISSMPKYTKAKVVVIPHS